MKPIIFIAIGIVCHKKLSLKNIKQTQLREFEIMRKSGYNNFKSILFEINSLKQFVS